MTRPSCGRSWWWDHGKARSRTKLLAKRLDTARRPEIPVRVGVGPKQGTSPQAGWVAGYELSEYPGTVREDGVDAIIETIHGSAYARKMGP